MNRVIFRLKIGPFVPNGLGWVDKPEQQRYVMAHADGSGFDDDDLKCWWFNFEHA